MKFGEARHFFNNVNGGYPRPGLEGVRGQRRGKARIDWISVFIAKGIFCGETNAMRSPMKQVEHQ